ncbi:CoA transferase [Williamsia sp. CHRR-6]|uniref:CoA transferase n=1 Tax=Williamsia sp. CHRR-6 TaxID=2835871 RepID=UPI001BDB05ED|nr:CoA transferase [Williamsia sp. CHRR-6]MBT0565827.1 CoA transferase [Williamsia sp. CHRR-6]
MNHLRDAWGRAGLAALSGPVPGRGDWSRAGVLAGAVTALHEFDSAVAELDLTGGRSVAGEESRSTVRTRVHHDAATLFSGRAGLTGAVRSGTISVGGATRLMSAGDGAWWALTLARAADLDLVPALVEAEVTPGEQWQALHRTVSRRSAAQWVARARLLGLPAAALGEARPQAPSRTERGSPAVLGDYLLVADLSSMWAGPLCGHLLATAGATVVKVESTRRPDGTRAGDKAFFRWLNAGKLSYAVDFDRDRHRLARLLAVADVVIESARPRALRRLGLDAASIAPRPGQVWLRITGHGATGDAANWVGFGDDAAVAGGLVVPASQAHPPTFCGDAIADPLTGIDAARLIAQQLSVGGGGLIDISLAHIAARYAELSSDPAGAPVHTGEEPAPPPPAPTDIPVSTVELGADTSRVEVLVEQRLNPAR